MKKAKGKARYVLGIALAFTLLMLVGIGTQEFFDDGIQLSDFRGRIVALPIIGIFFGFVVWWSQDKIAARLESDLKRRPRE